MHWKGVSNSEIVLLCEKQLAQIIEQLQEIKVFELQYLSQVYISALANQA